MESFLRRHLLTDAAILAAVPAAAFVLGYVYEASYLSVWDLPPEWAHVEPGMFFAVLGSIVGLAAMYGVARFVLSGIFKITGPITRIVQRNVALLLLCGLCYVVGDLSLWVFQTAIIFLVMDFLFPLLAGPRGKSYVEKVVHCEVHDEGQARIHEFISTRLGVSTLHVLMAMLLAIAFALAAGRGDAMRKQKFLVATVDGHEYVVVRKYGEDLLLAQFDRVSATAGARFRVAPATDVGTLVLEQIGKLNHEPAIEAVPTVPPAASATDRATTGPGTASPTPK